MKRVLTHEQTMKMYGITKEQLKAQYEVNLQGLEKMLSKSKESGKKVNGFTQAQLEEKVNDYRTIITEL